MFNKLLKSYTSRTLTRDLTLGLTALITLSFLLFSSFTYFGAAVQAEQTLRTYAKDSADKLAEVLSDPLWEFNTEGINQIADAYLHSEEIVGLRVTSGDRVFFEQISTKEDVLIEERPIFKRGQLIGYVELTISRESTSQLRRTLLFSTLSTLIGLLVTVIFAMTFLLQYLLNQPMGQIIEGLSRLATGQYNYRLVPLQQVDLNVIAYHTNLMAVQIQERDLRLQEQITAVQTLNEELDKRVQERTVDLERRSMQLQVAAEVARDATSTPHEVDDLLNRAVDLIRSRFGFYHAAIFIMDRAGEYAILRAAASEAAPAMLAAGHKLKVGETGIVGYVTHTGQPRIALDVGADGVYFRNPLLPHTRSEMALPLKVGDQIIGALDVQSQEEAAFDEQDIATLQTMADQIAIAIQNIRSYRRVLELDNLKSRFIANMSHELRTPLNAIIGFSEFLISQTYGELNGQQENLLERILTNGEHLLGLINDILDLSKIEAGKMDLLLENVRIDRLLEGVMSTAIGLGKEKNLELSLEIPREGLPMIWADQTRVRQVLLNLLSNAVKFTPAGGAVVVRAGTQNGTLAVSVQDTGIGIAPEDQAMVFEEFRQVDSDMNRQYQGTGLGLPICKRLIEMQGGTLTLESTPGKGSTFTFMLPVTQDPTPLPGKEVATLTPAVTASANGFHGTIVVVDDDPDAQTLLRHTLESAGWQVHGVLDSRTALEVIQEIRPDLVVLDIQMPYLDGWGVLRQLRADPSLSALPVVICSIVDPVKGQIGIVSGVQGWVVKPVDRQELLSQVKRVASPPAQIMVVDDDDDARLVVRSILEQSGWQVIEACDGEQALACLTENEPDLVVLDLMMPRVDGFEVLRRLSTMPGREHTPVIVVTAKELSSEESQWLSAHTQGYFQKAAFPITSFPAIVRSLVKPGTVQQKSINGTETTEAN